MSQQAALPAQNDALQRQAAQLLAAGKVAESIALLDQALAAQPSSAPICNDLARALWRGGFLTRAEEHFTKAVTLAPDDAYFMNSQGTFLLSQDRFDEAERLLDQALSLQPGHRDIVNNLGLLHHRRGDFAKAKECFRQAVQSAPGWPTAQGNLGNLLFDMGDIDGAEQAYRAALKSAPGNVAGWNMLVDFFRETGQYDKALAILQQFKSQAPFNERAWMPILELQETMNRLDDAAETLGEIKARFPNSKASAVIEGRLLRRRGNPDEARRVLESLGMPPATSPQYIPLNFELGQVCDLSNDCDAAFAAFTRAKTAMAEMPEARRFDKHQYINTIARIRKDFTPEIAEKITAASAPKGDAALVFLVGFPRSGTTLLDQILSSHPRICVAEEAPVMNQLTMHLIRKFGGTPPAAGTSGAGVPDWLVNNPCYPACLAEVTDGDAAELRDIFWAGHRAMPAPDGIFVDKLPLNLRHAALIHRVFPEAKFILALRHPCDSVLSAWMQQFKLNPAMMPFLDLDSSARLYDEAFSLWDKYTTMLPLKTHAIRYEDVVADFRPSIAALLEFLGVPWDDRVLDYDKTAQARNIATPSYHQVTQKLYTRASGRWLRYRKHLTQIIPVLETHAKKHGYSFDEESPQV